MQGVLRALRAGVAVFAALIVMPVLHASEGQIDRGALARIEAETQRLEDLSQVKRLQRAYGYYIDRGYWQEAADLFADDATFESGVDGVYVGRQRIHELLARQGGGHAGPGLQFGQFNHRLQLQPVVHVAADGRTAQGRWREFALLGQFQKSAHWGDGIYENRYVRQDGVWKIQSLRYFPNFVAPYKGGWASLQPVSGDWKSEVATSFPADRPPTQRYQPFPGVYVPRFHYDNSSLLARVRPPLAASPEAVTSQLEGKLALLSSRHAIENLQAAYGYYIDKGLWKQASELFARDATYEYGQGGVYVGRDRIRKALGLMGKEGLEPGQLNNYPMLQPIIDVEPDNRTARARWRSNVQLSRNGRGQWSEGTLENEYLNDNGVWRISRLHYYVTVTGDYDQGWIDAPVPMQGPSTSLPPDRPPTEVYESLPGGVYIPPYHYGNPVMTATPSFAVKAPSSLPEPLRGEIDALGARIERLSDEAQVERVQRSYGYYVDKAQWPSVADLFAEDGTLEISGRGVFVGRKRVLEYLVTGLGAVGMDTRRGQLLNHEQLQGLVTVSGEGDIACGRWTALVMSGFPKPGNAGWGDVTYENQYVKENGVWKIRKLRAPFNMYTNYKDGWQTVATPHTRPDSFLPPPDLPPTVVSLTYPSYYVEPYHYPNPVTGHFMPPPDPGAGGAAPMKRFGAE